MIRVYNNCYENICGFLIGTLNQDTEIQHKLSLYDCSNFILSLSVCIYMCSCACACVYTCIWRPEVDVPWLYQLLCIFFDRSFTKSGGSQSNLTGSHRAPGLPVSTSSNGRVTDVPCHTQLFHGAGIQTQVLTPMQQSFH